MDIQEIIQKYLPMLQELQQKVAILGDKRISMEVRVDWHSLLGDISILNGKGELEKWERHYFFDGEEQSYLDQYIIDLNAFFASQCITTPTGVASPVCLN